jgi:flagellar protein FlgJ
MYDDQLAVSLTKGRGMGIGEVMVKQLQKRFGEQVDTGSATSNALTMGRR